MRDSIEGAGFEPADETEPEEKPELEPPAPEPETHSPAPSADSAKILPTLEVIKANIETVEARIESLESKTQYQHSETERYMQYLSTLNEKLDHLQEEQIEIERLLKSNVNQA